MHLFCPKCQRPAVVRNDPRGRGRRGECDACGWLGDEGELSPVAPTAPDRALPKPAQPDCEEADPPLALNNQHGFHAAQVSEQRRRGDMDREREQVNAQ
jgi:hypothetical protein